MPTYRDHAVVLRAHKLGEADRIVTFLTRTHGKVRAVARGVRRTSSKFGGRLEPCSHVDIQFAQGRSLDVVAQVERLHAYGEPLGNDYAAYTAAHVMLEAADKLVSVEGEPAISQYKLLLGALRTLSQGTPEGPRPPTMILDAYLLRALSLAGYAPTLSECAVCGSVHQVEHFNPALGGMVCIRCKTPQSPRPRPHTVALLQALLTRDWSSTRDCDPVVEREASGLCVAFVNWHLEYRLRSLPLVERA